jgi:uncharacterized protein with FMN-binding domain
MRRSASVALAAAAAVGLPVTNAVAAAQAAAPAKAKAKPKAVPTHTYTGPSVDMQWGPVQVQIVVKGKAILDVKATYPTERPRSAFINDQAVPMLRSQVLKQQGIKNVYAIGGATMTSEAYGQSLQAALTQAHLL